MLPPSLLNLYIVGSSFLASVTLWYIIDSIWIFFFFFFFLIGQLFIGYRQLPWERHPSSELLHRLRLRSSCGSSSSSCRCRPCKYQEEKREILFFFFFPRSSYFPPSNSVASHPVATHRAETTGLINRSEKGQRLWENPTTGSSDSHLRKTGSTRNAYNYTGSSRPSALGVRRPQQSWQRGGGEEFRRSFSQGNYFFVVVVSRI